MDMPNRVNWVPSIYDKVSTIIVGTHSIHKMYNSRSYSINQYTYKCNEYSVTINIGRKIPNRKATKIKWGQFS